MPMTQTCTSTQNEILRYVYGETSNSENVFIEQSLVNNKILLDYYLDCLELKSEMDKISLSPRDSTVQNILSFSKNYRPVF
jgi:hypothetical protein